MELKIKTDLRAFRRACALRVRRRRAAGRPVRRHRPCSRPRRRPRRHDQRPRRAPTPPSTGCRRARRPISVAPSTSIPADVLFSIANLRIVPGDVLARVGTAINFHDGPLPGYAGLNVTTWALLAGETEHAVTWHLMTDRVDGGDVVAVETFAIDDDETAFSLNARCYEAALASFPRVAAAIAAGSLAGQPQPDGQHAHVRSLRPAGAAVRPRRRPAAEQVRAVRALDLGHRLRNTIGCVRLVAGDAVSGHRAGDRRRRSRPVRRAGTIVAADSVGPAHRHGRRRRRDHGLLHTGWRRARRGRRARPPRAHRRRRRSHRPDRRWSPPSPNSNRCSPAHEACWLDRLAGATPAQLPWDGRLTSGPGRRRRRCRRRRRPTPSQPSPLWLSRVSGVPDAGVRRHHAGDARDRRRARHRSRVPRSWRSTSTPPARSPTSPPRRRRSWRSSNAARRCLPMRRAATHGRAAATSTPRVLVELDRDGTLDVAAPARAIAAGAGLHISQCVTAASTSPFPATRRSPTESPRSCRPCSSPDSPIRTAIAATLADRRTGGDRAARRRQRHGPRSRPDRHDRLAVPCPGGRRQRPAGAVVRRSHAVVRRARRRRRRSRRAPRRRRGRPRRSRRHRRAPRHRDGGRRAGDSRARRRLRAARPDLSVGTARADGLRRRDPRPARQRRHRRGAGTTGVRRRRSGRRRRTGAGSRRALVGDHRAGRPRLRDLHVGVDRRPEGRDARAPPGHQLLRGDGRGRSAPTRPASGWP